MVIFLAGAHGVGKTFLGKPAAESLGFGYAAASSLIRQELDGIQSWEKNKNTRNVGANQDALVNAVSKVTRSSNTPLILDGHFVLRNETGNLIALPEDVFRRLELSSVILIEAPAPIVAKRLQERGAPQSLESIFELEEAELKHAENVCKRIGLSLTRLASPSRGQLLSTLQEIASLSSIKPSVDLKALTHS